LQKEKTPFDRLRANGSHIEIIIVSSVHAEPVEAQQSILQRASRDSYNEEQ
jgi:hypothetical protein